MRKKLITPETKVFPINYLLLLLNYLEKKGYQTDIILSKAQLSRDLFSDPEQFISYENLTKLLETILELTHEESLGLAFGQLLNFIAHGDIGHAIITSQTMGDAMQTAIKYLKTRTPLLEVDYITTKNDCTIRANYKLLPEKLEAFLIDTFFSSILTVRKFIVDDPTINIKINLKKPLPKNPAPYYDFFGPNVFFASPHNEYHFYSDSLHIKLRFSDSVAYKIAEQKCQQKLKEIEHLDDLISKIKSLMLSKTGEFPSLEDVASKLFMSARTLRRQLKELNTSYQIIFDELRKELALNYLQNTQISISEIAFLLAFSDSANFSRAFRKWVGKSPSAFRV